MFGWELSKRPLIPINDPQYESVLEQKHAHAGTDIGSYQEAVADEQTDMNKTQRSTVTTRSRH